MSPGLCSHPDPQEHGAPLLTSAPGDTARAQGHSLAPQVVSGVGARGVDCNQPSPVPWVAGRCGSVLGTAVTAQGRDVNGRALFLSTLS